jgi:predicted TIM-barrel fold metal-dependent hydrolase
MVWPNEEGGDAFLLDPQLLIDSGAIDRVWVHSTGNTFRHQLADQDEAVLDLARRFPDFVVPFAYLDFDKPPESIDRFHEQGFAGLKAIFPSIAYDDERAFPFYEKAQAHRMPVFFHTGGSPYWDPRLLAIPTARLASRNMQIQNVDLVAKVFPELTVICAHMGGAHAYDFALYFAKGHPNVYLEIACSILRDEPDRLRDVLRRTPSEKILFGSDVRGDKPIKKALFWKYYFETRRWLEPGAGENILGLNAERIIGASGYDPARLK